MIDPMHKDTTPEDFFDVGKPARESEVEGRHSLNGPIGYTNELYGSKVIKD